MTKATGTTKTRAKAKTPTIPGEHASAKKVRLAAEALGFEVWSQAGDIYHKPEVLYAETKGNNVAGTVRYPAKDFKRWRLRGRHKALPDQLAFDASWADGFMGGRIIDPAGKEFPPRTDYSYTADEAKTYGYTPEHAEKMFQERVYRYNNDGGDIDIRTRWKVATFGEFTLWIDDLIDLLRVDYPKITTKKKAAKTEEDVMHELLNPVVDYSL